MGIANRLIAGLGAFLQPPQKQRPGSTWEHDPPDSSMRPPPTPERWPRLQLAPGLHAFERFGVVHVEPEPATWTREPPKGPGWYAVQWHWVESSNPPIKIAEVVACPFEPLSVRNERGELEPLSSVAWWGARVPLQGPPPSEHGDESWG